MAGMGRIWWTAVVALIYLFENIFKRAVDRDIEWLNKTCTAIRDKQRCNAMSLMLPLF